MATAGVMLLKGPQARHYTHMAVHTQSGARTRQNTQEAVCGHRRSHVLEGSTGKAAHIQGGAHTRQNTEKAVYGHRKSHFI